MHNTDSPVQLSVYKKLSTISKFLWCLTFSSILEQRGSFAYPFLISILTDHLPVRGVSLVSAPETL